MTQRPRQIIPATHPRQKIYNLDQLLAPCVSVLTNTPCRVPWAVRRGLGSARTTLEAAASQGKDASRPPVLWLMSRKWIDERLNVVPAP